jgi:AcrR family transcriptional regulator
VAGTEGRVWGGLTARERDDRRRAQLLAAGLELFAAKGWTKVTVLDVCRAAKLSQRYFYEQFVSREALFLALVDHIALEVEQIVREEAATPGRAPDERAAHVLRALADHFAADPRKVRVALVESCATEEFRIQRARVIASFSALASRMMAGLRRGPGPADPRSLELSALLISGGVAEALIRTVTGDVAWTRDELVDHLTRLYGAAAAL